MTELGRIVQDWGRICEIADFGGPGERKLKLGGEARIEVMGRIILTLTEKRDG